MRDRIDLDKMPRFWEPKPSALWDLLLGPVHRRLLRRMHAILDVQIHGMEKLAQIPTSDGILLCPNHSYTGDGSLMVEFGRRAPRRMFIMAAWHAFRAHGGLAGWMLQRLGAFSVDREGCDRRAIKQATELLTTGRMLCIFPEGEIYHLNQKLTPLREGVAFIAAAALRELEKAKSSANLWLVPIGIRYRFMENVLPKLEEAMSRLEKHVLLSPKPGQPLAERILRFGEAALTIKEKDYLGHEQPGDLPARLARLAKHLLARREQSGGNNVRDDEPIPVRVKLLRQQLLEKVWEEDCDPESILHIREALADVHLALQLYSYPGDYLQSNPTIERMAETIEKYEEDVYGTYAAPKGPRRGIVEVGEPINVRETAVGKLRIATAAMTAKLEVGLSQAMIRAQAR
jgi:1-acyl-sn-glycerol-3-phosphate acyltransferase